MSHCTFTRTPPPSSAIVTLLVPTVTPLRYSTTTESIALMVTRWSIFVPMKFWTIVLSVTPPFRDLFSTVLVPCQKAGSLSTSETTDQTRSFAAPTTISLLKDGTILLTKPPHKTVPAWKILTIVEKSRHEKFMPSARHWVYAAGLAIYILNAWGAYVTLGGYGTGCGTGFGASWPLCNGTLVPNLSHFPTLIEYLHRFLSVVTGLIILGATVAVWRMKPRPSLASKLMLLAIVLVPIQVGIGGEVVASGLSALIATTHFCFATAIFALVVIAGALMWADVRPAGKPRT